MGIILDYSRRPSVRGRQREQSHRIREVATETKIVVTRERSEEGPGRQLNGMNLNDIGWIRELSSHLG